MTETTDSTRALEIARRLVQLGQGKDACRAYETALGQMGEDHPPKEKLEAALYILQNGGDYKVAYTTFLNLYNQGYCQEDLFNLMAGAFYQPNEKLMRTRYEKNCKLLSQYPYFFKTNFPAFEELPIRFFPFDDNGFFPFDRREARFGEYVDLNYPKLTHYFFRDLDKPILAHDVYSMYELSYLNDNVRKSEYVAKENHIYLHYTSWPVFCAWLQVMNLRKLLEDQKFVFLMEDELSQYPIDFKERFGIDYTQYPVKPLGIREVNRLIWHTQLSSHNGGDFFNEIFDNHPNLIVLSSVMLKEMGEWISNVRAYLAGGTKLTLLSPADGDEEKPYRLSRQLCAIPDPTDKDILVFIFLWMADLRPLDPASRIAPAIFFQPHFPNIYYKLTCQKNWAVLDSEQYQGIRNSPIFKQFPYIKTFSPIRRLTTSYAATVKFMYAQVQYAREHPVDNTVEVVSDVISERVLNRSFMIDPQDRLFQDSVLVRFEDGKLNPKATFTALCAFLDLPYTESMTYCSNAGERDPQIFDTNVRGFDPATVYRTYDEYAGDPERVYLEYLMRDIYEYCGYDFHYYDGGEMDLEKLTQLVDHFDVQDGYIRETWLECCRVQAKRIDRDSPENAVYVAKPDEEAAHLMLEDKMHALHDRRVRIAEALLRGLHFVNQKGQSLKMMPKLELDPELLEQELYH
jgi:hypothetical protein